MSEESDENDIHDDALFGIIFIFAIIHIFLKVCCFSDSENNSEHSSFNEENNYS